MISNQNTPAAPKFLLCLFFVSLISLQPGCSQIETFFDPRSGPFPFTFQKIQDATHQDRYIDFDHDGRDECMRVINERDPRITPSRIQILDHEFTFIEEVNFNGQLTKIAAFDWSNNGVDDICATYTRQDTSFLRIIDYQGKIIQDDVPLFIGKARNDSSGAYKWEGHISQILYSDLEDDGCPELILFPSEGYAQKPRGVYVYDAKSFKLKWHYDVGPALNQPAIFDFDRDGKMEILLSTKAPKNGNRANGTTDENAHLFLFNSAGDTLWTRSYIDSYSNVEARIEDLEADGEYEIIALLYDSFFRGFSPRIEIIQPQTGQLMQSRNLPGIFGSFTTARRDHKTNKEILYASSEGILISINNQLQETLKKEFKFNISKVVSCEDLDGDGLNEIVLTTNDGSAWLENQLNIKAKYASVRFIRQRIQTYHRRNKKPLILLQSGESSALFSLEKNNHYLLSFYAPFVAVLFSGAFLILLFINNVRYYRQRRNSRQLFELLSSLQHDPLLLLNRNHQVMSANSNARQLLQCNGKKLPLEIAALDINGELKAALSELPNNPPVRFEREVQFQASASHKVRLLAEPIKLASSSYQWLVLLQNDHTKEEREKAKTWSAMAQRIAHDINNPLTSIQLTLQRLQMEYRDQESQKVLKYEQFTNKIMERIESLRRMNRGFMKFLNLEKLNLQSTEINQFIENLFKNKIIELPQDIQLQKKFNPDLPATNLDQEQVQNLLENLIANAINAMPDGGTLSISTSLASDLQFDEPDSQPRDYCIIEVMDTGVGVPADIREKLFQPFTSRSHTGTGLGLTIVKKIVDDHQGKIEFHSEEGVGSSFEVYLPVA
ncbi:MAG: ATP-binding protein [bacterium]